MADALTGIRRADTASGVGWQGSALVPACMEALTGVPEKRSLRTGTTDRRTLQTVKGQNDRIRVESENGD